MVFSTCRGLGYEGNRFLKKLNKKIVEKRSESLGNTTRCHTFEPNIASAMAYYIMLYSRPCFSVLRTTLLCIRGTWNGKKKALLINEVDFAVAKEEALLK